MHKLTLYYPENSVRSYEVDEYNIYDNFLHFVDKDGEQHSTTVPFHIQVYYYSIPHDEGQPSLSREQLFQEALTQCVEQVVEQFVETIQQIETVTEELKTE